jgi:protein TonB
MKPKKSQKANMERNRKLFFEIGLVLTLGLVLLAFEWGTRPTTYQEITIDANSENVQEVIPVTVQQEKDRTPPPPPVPADQIEVVDDKLDIKDDFKIATTEVDPNDEVPYIFDDPAEVPEKNDIPYHRVEEMPTFKGGNINQFARYVQKNVAYPPGPQENGIEGTVYVKFVVNRDGSLSDFEVLKSPDPALTDEVLRVIKNSKGWKAGVQGNKKVRVMVSIPVTFKLN